LQTRLFFYMVVVGLLWPWLSKLGLGRLADDIAIERGNVTFYFPIVPDRERSFFVHLFADEPVKATS